MPENGRLRLVIVPTGRALARFRDAQEATAAARVSSADTTASDLRHHGKPGKWGDVSGARGRRRLRCGTRDEVVTRGPSAGACPRAIRGLD